MKILLDSHVVLWWQAGGDRLSATAAREIARADTILISPISCWEIATLATRKRIGLDRDVYAWTRDLLSQPGLAIATLTPQAAVAAAMLSQEGFHGDPADRLIYATARDLVVPLVTKDAAIHAFAGTAGDLRIVW